MGENSDDDGSGERRGLVDKKTASQPAAGLNHTTDRAAATRHVTAVPKTYCLAARFEIRY